jgi:hypothetical protein
MYHLIKTFWMGNIPAHQLCQLRNMMTKILCIRYARLSYSHNYPDNCVVHFFLFEVDLINWLAYHYPLRSNYEANNLLEPVDVDPRSCDLKRTSLLLRHWFGLCSWRESSRNLTTRFTTRDCGQRSDSQAKLAALFITQIQTRNVLQRSIVTRKNIAQLIQMSSSLNH